MKIQVIFFSNKLQSFEEDWVFTYVNRISKYHSIKLTQLKDQTDPCELLNKMKDKSLSDSKIFLLDETGKNYNSIEFSKKMEEIEHTSTKKATFVIGGSYGFGKLSKKSFAHEIISLSNFTFPHRLSLLILLEQIYRSNTIIAGHPYHHV